MSIGMKAEVELEFDKVIDSKRLRNHIDEVNKVCGSVDGLFQWKVSKSKKAVSYEYGGNNHTNFEEMWDMIKIKLLDDKEFNWFSINAFVWVEGDNYYYDKSDE
jgi:hypothetical protein